MVDPSDHEELVAVGSVTAVLNQHQELCALHKTLTFDTTSSQGAKTTYTQGYKDFCLMRPLPNGSTTGPARF